MFLTLVFLLIADRRGTIELHVHLFFETSTLTINWKGAKSERFWLAESHFCLVGCQFPNSPCNTTINQLVEHSTVDYDPWILSSCLCEDAKAAVMESFHWMACPKASNSTISWRLIVCLRFQRVGWGGGWTELWLIVKTELWLIVKSAQQIKATTSTINSAIFCLIANCWMLSFWVSGISIQLTGGFERRSICSRLVGCWVDKKLVQHNNQQVKCSFLGYTNPCFWAQVCVGRPNLEFREETRV